jgi:hypothetical protein
MHHIDDVQTALRIAEAPLIPETYGLVYLIMLPLPLFSRAMETRPRILGEVIPAAQEALREWSRTVEFLSDRLEVREGLDVVTAQFLTRLRWNSFEIMQTSFALTLIGRAQIREKEHGFQTTGPIHTVPELQFVSEMRAEFTQAMEAHQLLNDERPAEVHPVAVRMKALDPIELDGISGAGLPESTPRFLALIEEELNAALAARLNRDLLDGLLDAAQSKICQLCRSIPYLENEILALFREWWTGPDFGNQM